MTVETLKRIIRDNELLDREWLRVHGWIAVPVPSMLRPDSEFIGRLIEVAVSAKVETLYGVEVELESDKLVNIGCTVDLLAAFLKRSPRFGDAIISESLQFIILCPPTEIFIVAGSPASVEQIIGTTPAAALEAFRKFAIDPANRFYDQPDGTRYYVTIYEYYKCLFD